MTKYQIVTALYESMLMQVTGDPSEWTAFLRSACRNYKCRFDEQVLIYAQRPDAVAVLEIEKWNGLFGRWVNRGAKGIAVFDNERSGRTRLKHYFDISDTHESHTSRPVPVWRMNPRYSGEVAEHLGNTFGELEDDSTLVTALISTAKNATDDNLPDYLGDLLACRENSLLKGLDGPEVEEEYLAVLKNSVAYMLLTRCGIDAGRHIGRENFSQIPDFGAPQTANALGIAASDIAESVLREIASTVMSLQKQEKNKNRTFENIHPQEDNDTKQPVTERRVENGRTDIPPGGGLSDTQPDVAGGTARSPWQIRVTKKETSETEPPDTVHQPADGVQAERTSDGDRTDGERADGTADPPYGGGAGRGREPESEGPDALGGPDEQYPAGSGGNDTERPDIRIKPLPPEAAQLTFLGEAEENKTSAFLVSRQIIDEVLTGGGNGENSVHRIASYFKKDHALSENAAFLKKEYGEGSGKGFIFGDDRVSVWFSGSGIHIAVGDTALNAEDATIVTWEQAAVRIRELLDLGRYMPQGELDKADGIELKELADHLWNLHRDRAEGVEFAFMDDDLFIHGFPDDTARIAELLSQPDQRDGILAGLREFAAAYEQDSSLLRYPYVARHLRSALTGLEDLRREPLTFTADEPVSVAHPGFVTQDETDHMLLRGGNTEHGKFRIYSYFLGNHTAKEKADFLKHEYGTGGVSGTGYHEDHDGKGIEYSRGMIHMPYDKVVLSWSGAAGRVGGLIAAGRYMSEKELAYIPEYEKGVLAREIVGFYHNQPEDVPRPFPYATFSSDAVEIVRPQLDDQKRVREILAQMAKILDNTADFDRHYESMRRAFTDLTAYQNGEYSLFTPAKPAEKEMTLAAPAPAADHSPDYPGEPSDDVNAYLPTTPLPDEKEESLTPAWEQRERHSRTQAFDPHPEIPMSERHNYRITDDELGYGGAKAKFRNNIDAIKMLRAIESENRFATPEEQEILSKYVGWGGLPQAFDPDNDRWKSEYQELDALLSPEEWKSARGSTVNAHYTSPTVIRAIYKAVANMGFRAGNVLEPSCGIGNFFGLLPESMNESRLYGVELDSLTGRIARQLYQKNSIAIQGFEDAELPDSFFDLAIGNVPFGEYKISDRRYDKHNFPVHDYFFAKTLDKVRPGGIIAFITSKGTLDKQNPSVRKYIAQRAELLGAVRLPSTAFKANADTEVTADIIFLQKRDRIVDTEPGWMHLGQTEGGVPVNSYFTEHPDMILGEMAFGERTMYGNTKATTCNPFPDSDLAEQLEEAITNIHAEVTEYELDGDEPEDDGSIPADPNVRNFSYAVVNGGIYYRQDSRMYPKELPITTQNRVKGMIGLRECVRSLIDYQTGDYPDSDIRAEQEKLNRLYDNFTKKYGLINSRGNVTAFGQDSAYPLLCSLEVLDENGRLERKADMFHKRTIKQHVPVTHVDTAVEALAVSMSEKAASQRKVILLRKKW
jgi:hypothetical protein